MSASAGGSGTTLSVLFQLNGVDQAKSLLATVSPEFAKVQAAAKSAGTDVTTFINAFKNVAGSNASLNTLVAALTKLDQAEKGAAQSATQTASAFSSNKSSLDALGSTYGQVASLAQKVQQGQAAVSTEETRAAQAAKTLQSSHDALNRSYATLSTSAQRVATSETAIANTNRTLQSSTTGLAAGFNAISGSMNQTSTAVTKTGTAVQGAAEKNKSLKESFEQAVFPITTLVSSTVSLVETFSQYNQAALRVEQTEGRAISAHKSVEAAQLALNKAVQQYGADSAQASIAEQTLEAAKIKDSVASEKQQVAQENLNVKTAEFAQEIIPNVLSVVGSLGSVYTTYISRQVAATTAQKLMAESSVELGTATEVMGGEVAATSRLMSLISLTNPFFLALTIGGALIGAFITNLFGFRDAVNQVGVALGKSVGFLSPILTLLGNFGQTAVKTLGAGGDAAEAYANKTKEGMDTANDALTSNSSDLDILNTAIANVTRDGAGAITGFTTTFMTQFGNAQAAPKGLADATGTQVGRIETSLGDLEKTATTAMDNFNKIMANKQPTTPLSSLGTVTNKTINDIAQTKPQFGPVGNTQEFKDLDSVLVKLDGTTKQYFIDSSQLTTAENAAGVSETQRGVILGDLTGIMGIQVRTVNTMTGVITDQTGKVVGHTAAVEDNTGSVAGNSQAQNQAAASQTKTATAVNTAANSMKTSTAATNENSSSAQANLASFEDLTAGSAVLSDMVKKVTKDWAGNTQILQNATLMTLLHAQAIAGQTAKMKANEVGVIANADAQMEYARQLQTTEGQQLEFDQGAVKMAEQLNETTASIYSNQGALATLQAALASGMATSDAFAAAFSKQELALEQTKVKTAEVQGTVAAMDAEYERGESIIVNWNAAYAAQALQLQKDRDQIATTQGTIKALSDEFQTGWPQVIAYGNSFETTRQKILEARVALFGMQGELAALNQNMNLEGLIAFDKGLNESNIAFANATIAIKEHEGAILAYIQRLQQGTQQEQAATEARDNERKSMLESVAAISGLNAAYQEHVRQAQANIDMTVAYDKELIKDKEALLAQRTAIASNIADAQVFEGVMGSLASTTQATSLGFTDGLKSATEWGAGIAQAKGQADGFVTGLEDVAKILNVNLPNGFNVATKDLQQFIGVFAGVPEALAKMDDEINKSAGSIVDTVTKAMFDDSSGGKGGKGKDSPAKKLKETFDKLAKDAGIQLDSSMKTAIEQQAIGQHLADQLDAEMGLIKIDPAATGKIAQNMIQQINDAIAKDPSISESGQSIISKLLAIQPGDTAGLEKIQEMIDSLRTQTDLGTASIDKFKGAMDISNGAGVFSAQIGGMNVALSAYDKGILSSQQATATFVTDMQAKVDKIKAAQAEIAGIINIAQGATNVKPGDQSINQGTKPGPTQAVDTKSIDDATAKVTAFKTLVATIPAAITQVMGQANAAFATLTPMSPAFTSAMTTMTTILTTFGPAVGQAMGQANAAFGTLNPMQPSFVSGMSSMVSVLDALAPATSQVIGQVNTAFGTMGATVPGITAGIRSVWVAMLGSMASTTQQVTGNIATQFKTASTTVNSAFDTMKSKATSTFSSITSSANSAAGAVRALASAINSLQNKTVTITTVHKDVGGGGATGFATGTPYGPMIVDHPMNIKVGESGPEMLHVLPLKSGADKNMSVMDRVSKYANPGKMDMSMGSNDNMQVGDYINMASGTKKSKKKNKDDPPPPPIPFTSREWPAGPAHKVEKHPQKGHIEPGDYSFEHFNDYMKHMDRKYLDMTEANRRLTLKEYQGIHFDARKKKFIGGNLDQAWKNYRNRLIIEGVYEVYPMYDGKKPKLPEGAIIPEGSPYFASTGGLDNTTAFSRHYGGDTVSTSNGLLSDVIGATGGSSIDFGTAGDFIGGGGGDMSGLSSNPTATSFFTGGSTGGSLSGGTKGINEANSTGDRAPMSASSSPILASGAYQGSGISSSSPSNNDNLVQAIRTGISQGFGSAKVQLQNVNYIDSKKVSDATRTTFATKAGSFLK